MVSFFHLVFLPGELFEGIWDFMEIRMSGKVNTNIPIPSPAWRGLFPMGKAVGSHLMLWENAGGVVRKIKGKM